MFVFEKDTVRSTPIASRMMSLTDKVGDCASENCDNGTCLLAGRFNHCEECSIYMQAQKKKNSH